MSLTVSIKNQPAGGCIVTLGGRLDWTTCAGCEAKLNALLVPGTKTLVFDLANLDYISSLGLRLILKARKVIEGNRGAVQLINMQPQIKKVFEIANLLKGMTLFADIREADRYLDAMQKRALESPE
jgi:anti-anti-sigma factor